LTKNNLCPQSLLDYLQTLPETDLYWIGYSGGVDSHVLLHLLISIRNEINSTVSVVHINHGISQNSDRWSEHCKQVCDHLDVTFQCIKIDTECPDGESLENWARQQRYAAFSGLIDQDDILLTAHNRDDQAETVLLQLLRGSGPRGLSAMPGVKRINKGWLVRPLLNYSRKEILDYASNHNLKWIHDETNDDINYDRNYLRQVVIPDLIDRWPSFSQVVSRSARHQSEISQILEEIAAFDLEHVSGNDVKELDIRILKTLSETRIKNLIVYWLKRQNFPAPDSNHLKHILIDVVNSSLDSSPCVKWPGTEIRRYKNTMYALEPQPHHDPGQRLKWDMAKPIELTLGVLEANKQKGGGIMVELCKDNLVEVRFRTGGECIRLANRKHTHELKKLFQEHGVLPWYRDRIPLLYIENKLAAVAGLWIDKEFFADKGVESWQMIWTGKDKIFGKDQNL